MELYRDLIPCIIILFPILNVGKNSLKKQTILPLTMTAKGKGSCQWEKNEGGAEPCWGQVVQSLPGGRWCGALLAAAADALV